MIIKLDSKYRTDNYQFISLSLDSKKCDHHMKLIQDFCGNVNETKHPTISDGELLMKSLKVPNIDKV